MSRPPPRSTRTDTRVPDTTLVRLGAAHSEGRRQSVWDWWLSTASTRLGPPALVIAIGTRWHEDDFIGRLLSTEREGDPDEWEVISFPALAEEDDVDRKSTRLNSSH